jgi:hypothetical protein
MGLHMSRTNILRVTFFLVLVTLIALGLSSFDDDQPEGSAAAANLPLHAMTVSLFPTEIDVKVTEDQLGAGSFGGNLTIEKQQGIERVQVTLTASCGRGWATVVSPQTLVFINPGTQRFTVTVIVPPATPVSRAMVTVDAHAESPIWEEDESVQGTARVTQFFSMDIWTDSNTYDPGKEDSVSGKLYINNSGNGVDNFAIEIEKSPSGVTGFNIENNISIPPFMMADLYFTVSFDEDFDVPMDGAVITVVIKVTSVGAKDLGVLLAKTFPITVYFKGLEQKVIEEWQTYIAMPVILGVVVAVPVFFIRRRRIRKRELREMAEDREAEKDSSRSTAMESFSSR